MLDLSWGEILIIAAVALVVIGPKDLPAALKTVMHWVRKARGLMREFQSGVDDIVREAELDEVRKEINSIGNVSVEDRVRRTVDPKDEVRKSLESVDAQARDAASATAAAPSAAEEAAADEADAATAPEPAPDRREEAKAQPPGSDSSRASA